MPISSIGCLVQSRDHRDHCLQNMDMLLSVKRNHMQLWFYYHITIVNTCTNISACQNINMLVIRFL